MKKLLSMSSKETQLTKKSDNELVERIKKVEKSTLLYPPGQMDYDVLYTDLRLFLRKMSKGHVSECVFKLINLDGIFTHIYQQKITEMPLYSTCIIKTPGKLAGITLSTVDLGIKDTGVTNNIDNCIYAAYGAILRGSILSFDTQFVNDFDMHKLAMTYLYALVLKNLGAVNTFNKFQLDGIQLACGYIYLRHYLNYKHPNAVSRVTRLFSDIIAKENITKYSSSFELISRYKSIKDIGKILIDMNVISTNPNALIMSLLQNHGKEFLYHLLASVDYLFSVIVLSRYPTDLVGKVTTINGILQKNIEDLLIQKYYNKLSFDIVPVMKMKAEKLPEL